MKKLFVGSLPLFHVAILPIPAKMVRLPIGTIVVPYVRTATELPGTMTARLSFSIIVPTFWKRLMWPSSILKSLRV